MNAKFGKAFEKAVLKAVDLKKNSRRVESVTKKYRVPDAFADGVLLEIKGTKRLDLTKQVTDFLFAASSEGRKVVFAVTHETKLSNSFRELVESGEVIVVRFKPQ